MKERTKLILLSAAFGAAYFLPVANPRFQGALVEAFYMTREYARQHVLFCLVPAFFIAGAIACFISQAAVTKYFGARANKVLAYGVASVSGSILAVCSCTVLPLFAGIRSRGAGLVGGNSIGANLVASVAGAFMYFATCTEVPILEGGLRRREEEDRGKGAQSLCHRILAESLIRRRSR